ncbi:MAG: cation diffusion facilitator family transporter [Anaerolineales bacterium]|nr:cation diffusion facilitator family transporter [Anaerolineales bacterium]
MRHSHTHDSAGSIRTAFFLNLAFTVVEIFGGLWTNSLAILSDSIHDLGDSIALGLAWYLEREAQKEDDERFSYGYRRFSLLGALINTVILVLGSLIILSEAVPRLIAPEPSNAPGMVLFAVLGILVNGAAVIRLRAGDALNVRVVAWHLLEDVLGWVAVLIVSVILLFWNIQILDPILSILITLYVLFNVLRNLRKTLALFLQAVPESIEIDKLEERLALIENVHSIHHTHAWSLDGFHHVLTTHVVVEEGTRIEQVLCVKEDIRNLVRDYGFSHITIDIEYGSSDCMMAWG